jgi:hypothetical protein
MPRSSGSRRSGSGSGLFSRKSAPAPVPQKSLQKREEKHAPPPAIPQAAPGGMFIIFSIIITIIEPQKALFSWRDRLRKRRISLFVSVPPIQYLWMAWHGVICDIGGMMSGIGSTIVQVRITLFHFSVACVTNCWMS